MKQGNIEKDMEMEGEIKNLVRVWLLTLTSLCYCYFLASKLPKGKLRLFSLLPIFFIFSILPLLLSFVFPIALITVFFSWIGNFKLLLFAFDKGPLSISSRTLNTNSLFDFILVICLPIKIKENNDNQTPKNPGSSPKHPKLPLNWPVKIFLFAILVYAHDYKHHVPSKIMLILYCCLAYLLVDIIFGLSNGLLHIMWGTELESPSDEPYLSTSLQDFWGRRWNLTITNLLRHTIYKPVRSILDNLIGSKWASLTAFLATFIVSGLMHELLFYYVTRASPTWEVTWFFVLHGACLVVELEVKRVFSGKSQPHWVVSMLLTISFVMATAMWLFFPPVMRTGAVDRALEECKTFFRLLRSFNLLFITVDH